jgi:predicted ArsR family transcriptional regulator
VKPYEWARLVCADPDLTPMARLVAMTLAMHARGHAAPQSTCTQTQLASWTGLHRATVIRHLAHLVEREYLVAVRQKKRSGAWTATLYLLIHPESEAVDNPPANVAQRDKANVAQRDGVRRTERHHGGRTARHLEDKEGVQDAASVVDFIAHLSAGMRAL